ncbi:MAG: hypothetical protein DWQ30_24705 [Acidobacteria bacterium]|nr:MAG: hypothetical protein DWQ30_24705 [Acidobacteriota bacterium]
MAGPPRVGRQRQQLRREPRRIESSDNDESTARSLGDAAARRLATPSPGANPESPRGPARMNTRRRSAHAPLTPSHGPSHGSRAPFGRVALRCASTPAALTMLAAVAALVLLPFPSDGRGLAAPAGTTAGEGEADDAEDRFLSRTRRLIFEGRRSGEGYFSPDGSQMVFQAEREEGNPFYQIYRLDLESGETRRISPGIGKTTCSFIQPGTGNVLYASTHHDPASEELQRAELEFRASGEERRYSWDYDPEFDIWVADPESGEQRRLTDARGYDAEGAYSPDGEWIVFSSMRDAYGRDLSPEEQRQLEVDPSFFAELYIMRADGSDQRRLTHTDGYDGGPFFFPDGERIVWRRFDTSGLIADVWSMKPDGSDQKQITDFGAMSWAPYVHPSGEYILFASNKHGFSNFEVFIVDVEGVKEPVRVTTTDGFDGLPVPTPDGGRLVWTSNRHQGEGAHLYIAEWNHQAAREALAAAPPRRAAR